MSDPSRWGKAGPPPLSWFLDRYLKKKSIQPDTFARWLGVKPEVLDTWMSGAAIPDRAMLWEIGRVLGIPFEYLAPPALTPRGHLTDLEAELLDQFIHLSPRLQQVALLQIIALREAEDDSESP